MEKDSGKIIFLNPVCTHNIWGGSKLREEFGCDEAGDDLGECWGISAYPGGDGTVSSGPYRGMHLSELWADHRELFGGVSNLHDDKDEFPLLVKILDAREDLSIQVHPNDDFASANEQHALGKTECWYILDCPEDAKLVLGHNATSTMQLSEFIDEGKWNELIREVTVKKGDFIQINPGTVHAIKAGFVILETQQSSNVTYRLYDYDRLQNGVKRQLHIDKCKQVITTPSPAARECILDAETLTGEANSLEVMYAGMYYQVFKMQVLGEAFFEQKYKFLNVTVTDGAGKVDGIPVRKGKSFILPHEYGVVHLEGEMEFIASSVR
ncbi:MAG: class I mannose-6-phosphate isomerase [Lachnospiraceae bacterium]|nr:class I mannose-6-phosphate isomerase [Lachnospiraceae bacterium]